MNTREKRYVLLDKFDLKPAIKYGLKTHLEDEKRRRFDDLL